MVRSYVVRMYWECVKCCYYLFVFISDIKKVFNSWDFFKRYKLLVIG